jgi:hypothetical protein
MSATHASAQRKAQSRTHLVEADVLGLLAEALTADVKAPVASVMARKELRSRLPAHCPAPSDCQGTLSTATATAAAPLSIHIPRTRRPSVCAAVHLHNQRVAPELPLGAASALSLQIHRPPRVPIPAAPSPQYSQTPSCGAAASRRVGYRTTEGINRTNHLLQMSAGAVIFGCGSTHRMRPAWCAQTRHWREPLPNWRGLRVSMSRESPRVDMCGY